MRAKKLRRKGSIGNRVIVFAIFATIFSLFTSALTAYNDLAYQGLHYFALVVMLVAFLGVIGAVVSKRNYAPTKITIEALGEKSYEGHLRYRVTPSRFWNFITLESQSRPGVAPAAVAFSESINFSSLHRISRYRCDGISVAKVRNIYVDADLLETLMAFPNIVVLDLQGCQVDPDLWAELACFDQLEYLAVFGAMDSQSQRELHYSLPEIKAIFEPVEFVHASPDTV